MANDLSHKALHKTVISLAIPMVLSNMTAPLVGLVDSAVMGHLSSEHYLAAVGLGAALFTFIIWAMGFLRMITTGLVAQASGAEDNHAVRQWLILSSVLALILAAIVLLFHSPLIDLILWVIDGSLAVEQEVQIYWDIRIWSLPFSLLNAVLIGWFLGTGNARAPFMMLLLINLTNMALDALFVFVFDMRSDGVAYASLIAEVLGTLWALNALRHTLRNYPIDGVFVIAWNRLKRLLSLNGDLLIRTLALEAVFFYLHARGTELGDTVQAANVILLNLLLVMANGLDGFANAVEVLVGKAIGRQRWQDFRQAIVIGGAWSLITCVVFVVFFALSIDLLIHGITDIEAVRLVTKDYSIYLILMPLVAVWSFWLDGVFIGASAIKTMRNSMLLAVGIGFFPLFYWGKAYLPLDLANDSLWWAYISFMICRAVFSWWLLNRGIAQGRYIELSTINPTN